MGDRGKRFERGSRVRLQHAQPYRDAGEAVVVEEAGYRMALVRFDRPDRNGGHLDVVSAEDLERIDDERP